MAAGWGELYNFLELISFFIFPSYVGIYPPRMPPESSLVAGDFGVSGVNLKTKKPLFGKGFLIFSEGW